MRILTTIFKISIFVISICLFASSAYGFNLSATVSGGSGSWNDGWYEILYNTTVNFSVTSSGGTAPYTTCWNFGTPDGYKGEGPYPDYCHSTSAKPSHQFKLPGEYYVEVKVTDDNANTETAYLTVRVNVGSGSVITTTPENIQAAIDSASSGDTILITQAGSLGNVSIRTDASDGSVKQLKIDGQNYALTTTYEGAASRARLFWNNTNDDTVFWFHRMNVTYTGGNQTTAYCVFYRGDGDDQSGHDIISITDSTFTNFHGVFYVGYGAGIDYQLFVQRTNNLNWGGHEWQSDGNGSVLWYGQGAGGTGVILRWNYIQTHNEYVDVCYAGDAMDGYWVVENYYDAVGHSPNGASFLKWYGSHGSYQNRHVRGNIILGGGTSANGTGSAITNHSNNIEGGDNISFVGNYVVENASHFPFLWNPDNGYTITNVRVSDNYFWDINSNAALSGNSSATVNPGYITNNTCGANCSNLNGIKTTNWTGDVTTGNINDSSRPTWDGTEIYNRTTQQYYDPGAWEFDPPTNTSVSITGTYPNVNLALSAIDSRSGMGTNPRFPFKEGALTQFSNDGLTWSEVVPYATSVSWTLSATQTVYARFRDRDGNWSNPTVATLGAPAPPRGLIIK